MMSCKKREGIVEMEKEKKEEKKKEMVVAAGNLCRPRAYTRSHLSGPLG